MDESTNNRTNNFDGLRLIAALQVFMGHAIWYLDLDLRLPALYFFPGVIMFFTISGFLIFQSLERSQNFKQYFINRFIRIYPALLVCFLITFILLFFFKVITLNDLFSFTLVKWIFAQVSFFQFWTPDSLRDWGIGTPNGSLWTIPVEIQFYILLPFLLYTFPKIKPSYKFLLSMVLFVGANIILRKLEMKDPNHVLTKLFGVSIFPFLGFFIIGSLLSLHWQQIRKFIEGKALYWLLLFLVFILVFRVWPKYQPTSTAGYIINILFSILTISLAYTKPKLSKLLRGNDLSYGIYIYHALVLNCFIELGFTKQLKFLASSLFITLILAYLSWHFIEKRALHYKNKIR